MALQVPYRSIPDMLFQRVAKTPDAKALAGPNADDSGPAWLTWRQVGERTRAIGAGLRELGIGLEDRVAILSNTRLEWILVDLGINVAGAAATTVYPTTEPEDTSFIVSDSGSKILIAENAKQALKIAGAETAVTKVVLIDGPADSGATPPQITLAELEQLGAAALTREPGLIDDVLAQIGPDNVATLIYTSGTTGRPKGVELLHKGWTWEGVAQQDLGLFSPDDLHYLWLPMSHAFGKTLLCGILHVGVPTYVDGRVDKLIDLLAVIKPSLMCAPPRIYEKVYNKTVTSGLSGSGLKPKIFSWAVATGKKRVALQQAGKPIPAGLAFQYSIAEKLVFSKLQAKLGGNIKVLVSGSAALSRDISEFFAAANLQILEGYGMTEACAANFVNRRGKLKIGTVGQPLGDLEVRIDSDGEVLMKGPPVMRGYHNLPEATAEAFTEDGFLRTGDIGELDADGYLKITDRKKDLVKTSGGKFIAPSAIEGSFKAVCPYTSQAVVIGQNRNFVTMLIALDEEAIKTWAATGPLAGKSYDEIVAAPETHALVEGYIKELNAKLNRWETVKKFAILPRDLSIEAGEVTPSMKIKRRSVETNFASQIDKMYEGSLAQI
ncbi:AMP-dependent synthetase [Actinoplanes italicus]|uniref:Acyl-CoA synthetase n=1 Tax=Actinoplanes italicus TaxID=113567 RepID=A0A2T0KK14_9ACTN|nr:long-chain fatty acid--CoA ligase [Actinoplanes italicus]PRX23869.1 long-chain acyl-CoA synthetase [Actinoplanes italicus]GIE35007.1 AMP-dependent synthetase [Actinoplanes italicus]